MSGIFAGDQDVTGSCGDYILQGDVFVIRNSVAGDVGVGETFDGLIVVIRADGDGNLNIAHTNVAVGEVVNESAARGIAFYADAAGGVILGETVNEKKAIAGESFAADGHAVSIIKMIVEHADVRGALFDGDIVVAGVEPTFCDGDVCGSTGIDAVGVARVGGFYCRRLKMNAPRGEAVRIIYGDMKIRRIVKRNAIENKSIGMSGDN